MSSMRASIHKTALNQLGYHDKDFEHPGRYYAGGYNWCSEFVSWVYWQAGYPFTNGSFTSSVEVEGDDGSWMQRSTTRVINWFKENAVYIERDDENWYDFHPQTGDYVFVGRSGSDRAHSGLVEYVNTRGDLHTIEGNNAGRPVSKYSYPYYKINKTVNGSANGIILGFGILPER